MLPDLQGLMALPQGQGLMGRLSAAQTQPPAALQAGSSELPSPGWGASWGLTWSLRSRIAKMSLTPQLPGVAVGLS